MCAPGNEQGQAQRIIMSFLLTIQRNDTDSVQKSKGFDAL